MSKKLYFNWAVFIVTEEAGSTRREGLFHDEQEITEEEMLAIFKNKLAATRADDPVSDLVVKSRIPELPEDSIHEPTSSNPSPSKGLTKATTDVANPPSDPKRKANT